MLILSILLFGSVTIWLCYVRKSTYFLLLPKFFGEKLYISVCDLTTINVFAGYLKMKNGHKAAFAIMNRNVLSVTKARVFQDKVCEMIIGR